MTKKFYVLECALARKPFYAVSPNDWTWDVEHALKFKDFNEAFYYRQKHETLKMYNLKEQEFDFEFDDEETYVKDEDQLEFKL